MKPADLTQAEFEQLLQEAGAAMRNKERWRKVARENAELRQALKDLAFTEPGAETKQPLVRRVGAVRALNDPRNIDVCVLEFSRDGGNTWTCY